MRKAHRVTAQVFDFSPVTEEVLSPERYLDLMAKDSASIASARVVPAKLGERGFGGVAVRYVAPKYREVGHV